MTTANDLRYRQRCGACRLSSEWVEDLAAPDLSPAVIFFDGLVAVMRRLRGRRLKRLEVVLDRVGKRRLIVLDRQGIVGSPIADRPGDVRLGPHGVDRHEAPFERQRREELGNGRLFVRFRRRRPLSENPARPSGKGTDQKQRRRPNFPDRRLVLPSIATTSDSPKTGTTDFTQRTKAAPNSSASIVHDNGIQAIALVDRQSGCSLPVAFAL